MKNWYIFIILGAIAVWFISMKRTRIIFSRDPNKAIIDIGKKTIKLYKGQAKVMGNYSLSYDGINVRKNGHVVTGQF